MARELTTDLDVLGRHVELAGQDVLDVGCGSGHLVRALGARGARPVGLETSTAQLASAREADEGLGARYVTGRAEQLPLDDATMDLVVFMRALHHVSPQEQPAALREARRVLRPGGAVYVAEPLPEGSFFDLMSLVEDERDVRIAAQRAVAGCDRASLGREATVEYEVELRIPDMATLRSRIVSVDPERAAIFEARQSEIAEALCRLGEPVGARGVRFAQPMRADVLRA
ncbi:MAG: class I SAM-dependent methyltransferase [Actinomycetota bacterium]|nr:class I SAM-dependent methyltransferase [Actinomycetota bacterium]